jgi:hypothetical protein
MPIMQAFIDEPYYKRQAWSMNSYNVVSHKGSSWAHRRRQAKEQAMQHSPKWW